MLVIFSTLVVLLAFFRNIESQTNNTKQFGWADVKMSAVETEADRNAKSDPAWQGTGKQAGIQIWRIVQYKVTEWPKEYYGKFYNGDSYIILYTYKLTATSTDFNYNIHFWIGSQSTPDEYRTAAHKAVELDVYLKDVPVQYREVEGRESGLFKSYFKGGIIILDGGAESGVNSTEARNYTHKLLHLEGEKDRIYVREVPRSKERLVSGDVFILDLGKRIYQWNGKTSNKEEKAKGAEFLAALKSFRGGGTTAETLEEGSVPQTHDFFKNLDQPNVKDLILVPEPDFKTQLYRVSEVSGEITFTKVKEGNINSNDFKTEDVFIVDTGKECLVWFGKKSTAKERLNGIPYAHTYLLKTKHPLVPIVVVHEGQENNNLVASMDS